MAQLAPAPDRFVENQQSQPEYANNLTEEQSGALTALRSAISGISCWEADQPDLPFALDDALLLRFLRARKFNLKKSEALLREHLEWREKVRPQAIKPEDVEKSLSGGCWRLGGRAKDGSPIIYVQTALWNYNDFTVEEYNKYIAFWMERCARSMTGSGLERHVVLFDMKGWSLGMARPNPMRMAANLISIQQNHYPETLHTAIVVNVPTIFWGAWKVLTNFIDPVTAAKVLFVSKQEEVLAIIDKSQLMKQYGGTRTEEWPVLDEEELPDAGSGKPADTDAS